MRPNIGIWLIQERGIRNKNDDQPQDRGWLYSTSNLTYSSTYSIIPVNYSNSTPGDFVASGSSLLLPRVAADTRGQYSTLHYTGASTGIVRCAMQGQQRGAQERRGEGVVKPAQCLLLMSFPRATAQGPSITAALHSMPSSISPPYHPSSCCHTISSPSDFLRPVPPFPRPYRKP
jgi:hypothetical protein